MNGFVVLDFILLLLVLPMAFFLANGVADLVVRKKRRPKSWAYTALGLACATLVFWPREQIHGLVASWRPLMAPTNATEFWTMVAAIASILLLAAAVWGLNSLRIAKKDLRTRVKREAMQCAIDRCREFAERIVPGNQTFLGHFEEGKFAPMITTAAQVTFNNSDAELQQASAWLKKLPSPAAWSAGVDQINLLETWASYFMGDPKSGENCLAEHRVAFGPCAAPFCAAVIEYYPFLVWFRRDTTSGNFPNVVGLFRLWNQQLEEAKRGLIAEDLRRRYLDEVRRPPPRPLPTALGGDI